MVVLGMADGSVTQDDVSDSQPFIPSSCTQAENTESSVGIENSFTYIC